jgi:hypothetical protein
MRSAIAGAIAERVTLQSEKTTDCQSLDIDNKRSSPMPKRLFRRLMLAYSAVFVFLSVEAVISNRKVGITYFMCSVVVYVFANIGNIAYALERPLGVIRKYWIVVACFVVVQFVSEVILSIFYQDIGLVWWVVLWAIALVLYFPTFWANFSIALKKSGEENTA